MYYKHSYMYCALHNVLLSTATCTVHSIMYYKHSYMYCALHNVLLSTATCTVCSISTAPIIPIDQFDHLNMSTFTALLLRGEGSWSPATSSTVCGDSQGTCSYCLGGCSLTSGDRAILMRCAYYHAKLGRIYQCS